MSTPMHEPLSWLTLERYALDELPQTERARVQARLAESHEDRACLAAIISDQTELPPLPTMIRERPVAPPIQVTRKRRSWLMGGSALALAAALMLMFWRPNALPPSRRAVYEGTKGGEVALLVYGEHAGATTTFAQRERFKLLVTCPSWLSRGLRVAVFQAGQRYEPLTRVAVFACGNQVPWPGAFALDGNAPADVCLSFSASAQTFEQARAPAALEPGVVCVRLQPR